MDEKTDLTVFMEPEEGPNILQNDTIFVAHAERGRGHGRLNHGE